MSNEHIINTLEAKPFGELDESDLVTIEAHVADCDSCRRAFSAAQVSALMLNSRAAAEIEPPPFFQTRVLAALRERQAAREPWAAWSRLWRTAGGLAASMAATVAMLAVLTFVAPGTQTGDSQNLSTAFNAYSTEAIVLDEGAPADDQVSDTDVLATLYGADDEVTK